MPNPAAEGWEDAFGDQDFAKGAKQDPLVMLDAPR